MLKHVGPLLLVAFGVIVSVFVLQTAVFEPFREASNAYRAYTDAEIALTRTQSPSGPILVFSQQQVLEREELKRTCRQNYEVYVQKIVDLPEWLAGFRPLALPNAINPRPSICY